MKTVCEINQCTGCMACVEKCKKNAIKIKDNMVSYNAVINEKKCIECGICHKICHVNGFDDFQKQIYWKQGWTKNENVREKASSGGVASAIELAFIKNGGCVGSCFFENGIFKFKIAENISEIASFSGSKYVKSNPMDVYWNIQNRLKKGEKVLFVALPCQVAAVKKFVEKRLQDNLYTIDLICHGTPSPKVLEIFLKQYGLRLNEITDIQFRTKNNFFLKENKQCISMPGTLDEYSIAFLNSISYTENCYSCKYAKCERVSDITLGDSWGSLLDKEIQRKGLSLILCQSRKGNELLEMADLELKEVDLKNAIANNHQLEYPSPMPKKRYMFFEKLEKGERFNRLVRTIYVKQSFKQIIKGILIRIGIWGMKR